jgi:hypothetical protein
MTPTTQPAADESRWLRLWDLSVLTVVEVGLRLRHRRLVARLRGLMRPLGVRRLHLADPRLANEKFFWRKTIDHDPRFTVVSDKIDMRRVIEDLGVAVSMPRVHWTGESADDLPGDLLAADVVIKAAHGWNMSIIVRDCGLEPSAIRDRCRAFLAASHGAPDYEWAYFDAPHRLIVEERLYPGGGMIDLKVKTFGPVVETVTAIHFDTGDRTAGVWFPDGRGGFAMAGQASLVSDAIDDRPLPATAAEAVRVSERIGAAFDHVRVDFMTDGRTLYLGELTLYSGGGIATPFGHQPDSVLNRSWDLRRSWFLTAGQRGWRRIYAASLLRAINRRAAGDGHIGAAGPLPRAMLEVGLRGRAEGP